jgi:hypothetical protein
VVSTLTKEHFLDCAYMHVFQTFSIRTSLYNMLAVSLIKLLKHGTQKMQMILNVCYVTCVSYPSSFKSIAYLKLSCYVLFFSVRMAKNGKNWATRF